MATKPVTVGVDGSEESLRAVEWAALEARRHGSVLRLVSAPAELPQLRACQVSPGEIAAALRGIAARFLDAAIIRSEEVAPGLPSRPACCPGRRRWPWRTAGPVPPCWSWGPGERAGSRR